jgi:GTP-binding protein HflX
MPHHLVASFPSTLEETIHSQLLVILVDASDPNAEMQLQTVQETLDDIGATQQRRLIAINKVDLIDDPTRVLQWLNRHPDAIPISARTGAGLDELASEVRNEMLGGVREVVIDAPMTDSATIDFVEKRAEVLDREYSNGRASLTVRLGRRHVDMLLARGAQLMIDGRPAREAREEYWPDPAEARPPRVPPHERYR